MAPFFFLGQSLSQATSPEAVIGVELVVAMLAVIALNAVFVAGETAIELVRGSHVKAVALEDKKCRILQNVLEHKQLYVAACFLGSQTMRAWLVLLTIPFALMVGPLLALPKEPSWLGVMLAGFLIGIPAVAVNVVFGELVPRTYASADPAKAAMRTHSFVRVFAAIFKPVTLMFMAAASLLTKRFGAKATFSVANQAEEEIKERLEQAVETQEIEEEEKEMLHSVFEFGDTVAREIMTPRVDMDAVPVDMPIPDVVTVVQDSGHSRIPVYEGSDDQIVGIVHAKDLLSAVLDGKANAGLRDLMRPATFVPENKSLHDLLQEMRAERTQMVIVQDEFGGTAGVVTVEDIVEEVVGEIVDEYDDEEPEIAQVDGKFRIEGKTNIYDVNDEIGTAFESDEFDTIGGYVFGLFGRQPTPGESIEADGYLFTVLETDGRRISTVGLEKLEEPTALDEVAKAAEGLVGS